MNENLKEQTQRGSFLFPFERYHTCDASGNFYVSCHWHPDTEIIYLQKGSIRLFINGSPHIVEKDTIIFINREELHNLDSLAPGTTYDALVFPLEFLSFDFYDYCQHKYLLPLIQKKLFFPSFLKPGDICYNTVRECITGICSCCSLKSAGYQMAVKAFLLQILACLIQQNCLIFSQENRSAFHEKKLDTMKNIVSYLQEHISEKILVDDVASICFMSANYFCKYFKHQFGKTFTQYVNGLRLEKACRLLEETDLPVMEISLQCGFENLSYFVRLFKKDKGVTPSDYRRRLPLGTG